MSAGFPPIFDVLDVLSDDPALEAGEEISRRLEAGEDIDGLIVHRSDPAFVDLIMILTPEQDHDTRLAPFVLVNALIDALAAALPPMMPITASFNGDILIDGMIAGSLAVEARQTGDVEWMMVRVHVDLLHGPSSIAALSGETIEALSLKQAFARHALAWLNRWHDDGFAPIRELWNFRCHERLANPQAGIDEHGMPQSSERIAP